MTVWAVLAVVFSIAMLVAPSLRGAFVGLVIESFAIPVLTFTVGAIGWILASSVWPSLGWSARSYLICCTVLGLPVALGAILWMRGSELE